MGVWRFFEQRGGMTSSAAVKFPLAGPWIIVPQDITIYDGLNWEEALELAKQLGDLSESLLLNWGTVVYQKGSDGVCEKCGYHIDSSD